MTRHPVLVVITCALSLLASSGCYVQATPTLPEQGIWSVVRVVDGDTLILRRGSFERRARLIGVDTPETVHPNKPQECFGREASNYTKRLVEGKNVRVATDDSQDRWDRYNRWLVYIWQGKNFLNEKLIKDGYGREYTYQGNPYFYQKDFRRAEQEARRHQRGLWNPHTCPSYSPNIPVHMY